MMREIALAIIAIVFVGFLLYFMSPMLITLKSSSVQSVNMSDPVIASYFEIGDGLYGIIGLVAFGVIAFLLVAYATRNERI